MKKYLTMLLALVLSLSLLGTVASCGATIKVTDFAVDDAKVVKTVKVGEDIDVSKVKATVSFDDDSEKELTASDVEFYHGDEKLEGTVFKGLTDEIGEVEITVKYLTFSKTIKIAVENIVAVSIELDSSKVPYVKQGRDVELGTVTASVAFDDDSERDIDVNDLTFYVGETKLELDEDDKVSGITDEVGTVTIKAVYREVNAEFTITVIPLEINDLYEFESIVLPKSEKARTGYAEGFLDASVDATARLVGDDNEFRFLPVLNVYRSQYGDYTNLTQYSTVSTIKTLGGDKLVAEDNEEDKTTEYYFNDKLIATSYYEAGEYQFTSDAVGNTYVIAITPRELEVEEEDFVTVTVKIVDGYNVYDAKDLAIIDNTTQKGWSYKNGILDPWLAAEGDSPDAWAAIRAEKGFTVAMSNATRAVVLQRNIDITPDDLPKSYVGTVSRSLQYYAYGVDKDNDNKWDKAQVAKQGSDTEFEDMPAKTEEKRLTHDDNGNLFVYERTSNQPFTFYGNFYTLDASQIPLASATQETAVEKGKNGENLIISDYGDDCSNASLFRFSGVVESDTGSTSYSFNNLNVVGNANTEQWVIYEANDADRKTPKAVNAGGFIFAKARYCDLQTTNVNMNRCFIGYLLEDYNHDDTAEHIRPTTATAEYVKVTDSYNDAAFIWGKCDMTVKNSVFKTSGGPLIIMQHVRPVDQAGYARIPRLTVENSDLENFVTGYEMWFADRGADGVIPTLIAGTNGLLQQISAMISQAYGTQMPVKTATKKVGSREDCLDLIVLVMSNGAGAASLGTTETQGYCSITQNGKVYVLDRTTGSNVRTVLDDGDQVFNVNEATGAIRITDGALGGVVGADLNTVGASIYTGEYIVFNQAGMGLMLGTFTK